ncbi:MAG: GTPase [Thermodesulforhabdaceae bacterium]
MEDPAKRPDERLKRIILTIEKLPEWACSFDEKENLKARARNIEGSIKELSNSVLTIGILGGTGVGKSTIMNALAGDTVSLASHRRPYTSELIIYAHEEIPVPGVLIESNLPVVFYRHRANKARNLLLCDVPDFDSIKLEHRNLVRSFLNHFDLLVWVVSLEKYADEAFYEFLREVTKEKDPSNFYFLLNKIDLLRDESNRLELLVESFVGYLTKNGISRPLLFLVSAKEVLENKSAESRNQWFIFEREVFRERELKEIQEIKHSNIAREIEQIEEEINRALQTCISAVEHIKALRLELSQLATGWELEGKRVISRVIKRDIVERVLHFSDSDNLKGPAYLISRFVKMGQASDESSSSFLINDSTMAHFSSLAEQLNRLLLVRSVPPQLFQDLAAVYDPNRLWADWKEKLEILIEDVCKEVEKKKARFLNLFQGLFYWGLGVIFVLAVGEFRYISEKPLWIWFCERILRFFERIFTLEGLGALISLLILELFVGYYFFRLYRKGLQERTQKVIEMVGFRGFELWKQIIAQLDECLRLKEEFYGSWMEGIR